MGVRAREFGGRPCDWPGCATSADPSVSFAHSSPVSFPLRKGVRVRAIALDVHRDFCEVAIAEEGKVRSAGRIATRPEALELFAQSLTKDDRVALEVTGNAWEIARIIEPHVARVDESNASQNGCTRSWWFARRSRGIRMSPRSLASAPAVSATCWRRSATRCVSWTSSAPSASGRSPHRARRACASSRRTRPGWLIEAIGRLPTRGTNASATVLAWRRAALAIDDYRRGHGWTSAENGLGPKPTSDL